jgi:hypothetical protein
MKNDTIVCRSHRRRISGDYQLCIFPSILSFFLKKAIHTHVKVIEHENREKKRASKHTTKIIL